MRPLSHVGDKVDISLKGPGYDPPEIYWTTKHLSFAIIQPNRGDTDVSDQGYMLANINKEGVIQWWISDFNCQDKINREAILHFGLTWSR